MNHAEIMEVLADWNHWDGPADTGTARGALGAVAPWLSERHILVVTGVRRGGKSTFLRQLGEEVARGGCRRQVLHVNFEDPRWLPELGLPLLDQIVSAYRERLRPDDFAYLFLDEIQLVPGWERWVRARYDRDRSVKIVLSGSTSSLIAGALGALLTGRHLSAELFPFSLAERLAHEGHDLPEGDYHDLRSRRDLIRGRLREHLECGGFPEVCARPPVISRTILQHYFEDIIARDVVARHNIRDARALRVLAHYAVTNVANELAPTRTARLLDLSTDTLRQYMAHLEEAYLLGTAGYASPSLKVVAKRNRKVYAVDCGLRNAVARRFSADSGRLAENLVYLRFREQGIQPEYWRNGAEADFILTVGGERLAVNVSFTDELPAREQDSLAHAMSALDIPRGLLVTDGLFRQAETTAAGKVATAPLWYFLLCPTTRLVEELDL